MPKRNWTEEERKAFGAKMKAAREARQAKATTVDEPAPPNQEEVPTTPEPTEEPAVVGAEAPEESVVGARLDVDNSEIKSMLEGITEDSEVDIFNPLDQGFRVQFTITAYQPVALSAAERDTREKAGLPLEKDMNQSVGRVVKYTVLPPHKVTRLPGKVAHVAIKQLRNYLMRADRDNYADVADPAAMRQYEEKIVIRIGNSLENMNVNHQNEIDRKIAELNQTTI